MYATNYFETAFLNTMRGITLNAPAQLYVGLFISNPTEKGEGKEIEYTDYKRQPISFTVPAFDAGVNAVAIKNDKDITFPAAGADAGTVTHLGILDSEAVGSGNMWAYGEAGERLIVNAGEAPVLIAQEVIYYTTGNLSDLFKAAFLNVLRGQSIDGFESYLALFNGSPNSGGAELSGENYARAKVDFTAPAEAESGQSIMENSAALKFNRPTTPWGTWDYTSIYDSQSGGRPVMVIQKTPPKEIKKGYMPIASAGSIKAAIN